MKMPKKVDKKFSSGYYNIMEGCEMTKAGIVSSQKYISYVKSYLGRNHYLSNITLENKSPREQSATIISADLDPVENKYILTGQMYGEFAIYNCKNIIEKNSSSYFTRVCKKRKRSRNSNEVNHCSKFEVANIQWFPVDAGLFATSGYEKTVKIWDPNTLTLVEDFQLSSDINHFRMSYVASRHSLLAAAVKKGQIILCDLRTGSSTHCLNGHEGPVLNVHWARHHESHLFSGGRDGTIRIWDVRSGKASLKILKAERKSTFHSKKKKYRRYNPEDDAISDLCCSYDGRWLYSISLGGDIGKWNSITGKFQAVKFPKSNSTYRKPNSISITKHLSPDLLYVPNKGAEIDVFDCSNGALVNKLYGHMGRIYQTIFNPLSLDLYSFGADKHFLVWKPKVSYPKEVESFNVSNDSNYHEGDNWSDDD